MAHEWDTIVYTSQIGAKRLDSSPSEEFLLSGKPLYKGDVFEYDLEKIIESATSESKKVAGFSGEAPVLTMQMQAYPTPHSKQWFFVVTLIDEAKNIVRVIVNSNGDSWRVGKMHDAFESE